MGERIMKCEQCGKQTVHIKEGRRFQIGHKIETFFRCTICDRSVRVMCKKPGNKPRGHNAGRSY
jgi:DNA-directed RNA polymerase subunit RPC12/RpoP